MSVATITTPDTTAAPATTDTAWTMPAGLDASEQIHYRRGYARAYAKSVKLNPSAIGSDGPSPAPGTAARTMLARRLAGTTRAAHEIHHPGAHKAGMSALRSYVRKTHTDPGARLAAIVDPAAPAKVTRTRKAPTAAPVDVTPAPTSVDTDAPAVVHAGYEIRRDPAAILSGPVCARTDVAAGELAPNDHGMPVTCPACLEAVAALTAATPATVPADMPRQERDARRASNRELAAAMRARGILPTGPAWQLARAGADLDTLAATIATMPAGGAK